MKELFFDCKESRSNYKSGDYLVCNNENGKDAYCIGAEKFELIYELYEQYKI